MPLNVTPAGNTPAQPNGPPKYVMTRNSPGMGTNTAPIDQRALPPGSPGGAAARPADANGRTIEQPAGAAADVEQEGASEEGDGTPGGESWRFAKLAEKDRQARTRLDQAKAAEARLKEQGDALARREAAIAAEETKRATWRTNPAQLLRDHGFVPESALQFMLNGEKLSPEQKLALDVDQRLEQERGARVKDLEQLRQEQAQRDQEREQADREQEEREQTSQQQAAVAELHADIGDVVSGDPKSFPLLHRAGERAGPAVFQRLNEISDKTMRETGRRPPVTTKMIERAAADVEAAARKEMQETLSDPNVASVLGVNRTAPRQQRTLSNDMPQRQSVTEQQERPETEAEKRERVKREIEASWQRRKPQ